MAHIFPINYLRRRNSNNFRSLHLVSQRKVIKHLYPYYFNINNVIINILLFKFVVYDVT